MKKEYQPTENYKQLLRKIKDLNKWRDIPCTHIRRLDINSRINLQIQCNSNQTLNKNVCVE